LKAHSGYVSSVAFSPDCKLLATGSWDKSAILWHINSGSFIYQLEGHTCKINSVAFSPNSKLLVTGSND